MPAHLLLAKSPPQDVESQTSTMTGPPTPTKNAQGYEQLSSSDDHGVAKSLISDETKMTPSVAPWKRKTNAKSGEYSNTFSSSASAPAAKSLSFENPSYADVPSGEQEREESMAEDKSSAAGLLNTAHSDSTLQQRPSTLPICPSNNNAMSTTATTSGDKHMVTVKCVAILTFNLLTHLTPAAQPWLNLPGYFSSFFLFLFHSLGFDLTY